jgi:hypothetical protein
LESVNLEVRRMLGMVEVGNLTCQHEHVAQEETHFASKIGLTIEIVYYLGRTEQARYIPRKLH